MMLYKAVELISSIISAQLAALYRMRRRSVRPKQFMGQYNERLCHSRVNGTRIKFYGVKTGHGIGAVSSMVKWNEYRFLLGNTCRRSINVDEPGSRCSDHVSNFVSQAWKTQAARTHGLCRIESIFWNRIQHPLRKNFYSKWFSPFSKLSQPIQSSTIINTLYQWVVMLLWRSTMFLGRKCEFL